MNGGVLDAANPAASVFKLAAGEIGYRLFGVVFWAASITSVVGSAYTSVSFLRTSHSFIAKNYHTVITVFIVSSALIFLWIGRPVHVLIMVGALNGFILPMAMAIILLACRKPSLMGDYRHPQWLTLAGWIVLVVLAVMSIKTMIFDLANLWR
jgi:Mn2+/Fe2+ NRAMP family transporter